MPSVTGMTVDYIGFNKQIERFAKMYNLNIGEEMTNQMRLWCGDNIKNFPPALNMQKRPGESKKDVKLRLDFKSDKAMGIHAVEVGIREVISPMTPVEVSTTKDLGGDLRGKKHVQSETTAAGWAVEDNDYNLSANMSAMEERHNRFRRKGRVPKGAARNTRAGRMTQVNKLHVKRAAFRKYKAKKQKTVGQLKSGWVAGLVKFGGKVPAKWISNGWVKNGSASPSKIGKDGNGTLWARNRVRYASSYKRISDYNLLQRPRLAVKAMKKKRDAMIRSENRRSA